MMTTGKWSHILDLYSPPHHQGSSVSKQLGAEDFGSQPRLTHHTLSNANKCGSGFTKATTRTIVSKQFFWHEKLLCSRHNNVIDHKACSWPNFLILSVESCQNVSPRTLGQLAKGKLDFQTAYCTSIILIVNILGLLNYWRLQSLGISQQRFKILLV